MIMILMFTIESAREFLRSGHVFFGKDEDADDPKWAQTINLNDSMWWGTGDGEYVPDESLVEVATLFYRYGWCGILYWASQRENRPVPEFLDVRRFIEFVREEENLRREIESSSKRAYHKIEYKLGEK